MSDANRTSVAFIEESQPGVTPPTPAMQVLRSTSSNLLPEVRTTESQEIRQDRMIADIPETGAGSGGDVQVEWSTTTYDKLIAAAIGSNDFTPFAGIVDATDIALSTTGSHLTSSSTDLTVLTDGDFFHIEAAGDPTQSNWYRVENVTTNGADLVPPPTANVSAGTNVTIKGSTIRNGLVERTFSVEVGFVDVLNYFLYDGQRVGMMSYSLEAENIMTGAFGFRGEEATPKDDGTSFADSYVAATTTPVLNATSNVARILENDSTVAGCVRTLSMDLNNNLRDIQCVGSKYPTDIGEGTMQIEGSITVAMGPTLTMAKRHIDRTPFSLSLGLVDSQGNGLHFYYPKVLFREYDGPIPGINQDVDEQLSWRALVNDDTTNPHHIAISTFSAS